MRLFLAVAVLMLALVACTEAQDTQDTPDAETLEQRFNQFREQVNAAGQKVAEGAKAAFQKLHDSDFAVKTRASVADIFERIKSSASDLIS